MMRILDPRRWFSNAPIDEFGRALARELSARYTLEMDQSGRDKKSEKKLGRALNLVYGRAREFKRENRLGVYRKARLGNAFRWELKEMGYREAFIEQATKGLVLNISQD